MTVAAGLEEPMRRGGTERGLRPSRRHQLLGGGDADLKVSPVAGLRRRPGPGTGTGDAPRRSEGPAVELEPPRDRRVADRPGEVGDEVYRRDRPRLQLP